MFRFTAGNARRDSTANRSDLALELAHAGFVRVIVDDLPERVVLPVDLFGLQAVFFHLPPDEITFRDLELLALGVTGQRDHFHPVAHRFGHAVDVIRGRDKNDLRKIERYVEVAIDKSVVLARIEHFEQRARWIAAKIGADLVDLVEHENRIASAGAAQLLNDSSRHRTDVSAPVSANFRFVAHSAETDSDKLAAERVSDGLTKTGFADAGRPEKTQDWSVPGWIQFAHGQIFDQPLFHFLEIVMVAIKNLLCLIEIEIVLAQFVPGKVGDDLDVTDDDGKFGTGWRNKIEPFQFALRLLHHLFRRIRFRQASAQLFHLLIAAGLVFTEFVLDRFDLRTQIGAPLRIGKLRRDVLLQFFLDLRDLQLGGDMSLDRADSLFDVRFFENRLLLCNIDIQVRRQKISELFRSRDVQDHQARLLRRFRRKLEQSRSRIAQVSERRFPFLALRRRNGFHQIDFRPNKRRSRDDLAQTESVESSRDDDHVIVGLANH